jgi:hypothetical protein
MFEGRIGVSRWVDRMFRGGREWRAELHYGSGKVYFLDPRIWPRYSSSVQCFELFGLLDILHIEQNVQGGTVKQ